MATTKETMKVIAGGLDREKAPEFITGGRIIAVEVPDELTEVFEGLIGSLTGNGESAETETQVMNQNDNGDSESCDDLEPTPTEELAGAITIKLAAGAADAFMEIASEMDVEATQMVVKNLENARSKSMVRILRTLFLTQKMKKAVKELDLLDICQEYDAYSYELFQDCFLEDERIDWYCVENWLTEKNIQHNSKLS
jgi:hypothetical protein